MRSKSKSKSKSGHSSQDLRTKILIKNSYNLCRNPYLWFNTTVSERHPMEGLRYFLKRLIISLDELLLICGEEVQKADKRSVTSDPALGEGSSAQQVVSPPITDRTALLEALGEYRLQLNEMYSNMFGTEVEAPTAADGPLECHIEEVADNRFRVLSRIGSILRSNGKAMKTSSQLEPKEPTEGKDKDSSFVSHLKGLEEILMNIQLNRTITQFIPLHNPLNISLSHSHSDSDSVSDESNNLPTSAEQSTDSNYSTDDSQPSSPEQSDQNAANH